MAALGATLVALALGRLAAHWRGRFRIPLVGVTGSNGKTTVKEMTAAVLRGVGPTLATEGNLNNDIGVPLTLARLGPEHRFAVVEMGANHPGEIAGLCAIARPRVGVVTHCAPAHLEGFGSVEGVARAKGELFAALPADGTAVVNADDAYAGLWIRTSAAGRRLTFGLEAVADVTGRWEPRDTGSQVHLVTPAGEADLRLALPKLGAPGQVKALTLLRRGAVQLRIARRAAKLARDRGIGTIIFQSPLETVLASLIARLSGGRALWMMPNSVSCIYQTY